MNNRTLPLFIAAITALSIAGCNIIQRAELIRRQNVRNAANKYATGDWIERGKAVREIIKYYGPEKNDLIVGTLLVAIQDPYPSVRIEALKGFYRFKLESSHDVIRKTISEDKSAEVRRYALRALRAFKDPVDVDIFIRGFHSEDWLIREESIKGLLVMNDETIKARLIPIIISAMNDPAISVSITTLRRLKTKDDKLYQAITEKFNSETEYNYSLLEATLIALKGYKLDEKTRARVINLLVHQNITIRLLALKVLKKEKNPASPGK
jgi:HEAT repeat protein